MERQQQQLRAKRKEWYDQVVALHQAGKGVRTIARELHINRQTVRRFVLASGFPERALRPAVPSKLNPYAAYLEERWRVGETTDGSCGTKSKRKGSAARWHWSPDGRAANECWRHRRAPSAGVSVARRCSEWHHGDQQL